MTDLDQLDIMRRAITALGLGQVAPEELVASARASAAAREDARRLLSDANVRIKDLESALRDLGVNPGGDLPGEVRAIINRIAGDSAAAQHDLDCVLRERDAAKAKIASNVAEAAARDMRIADLERDLAAKDASLKTAHAALTRICEVIGAPVPVCPDDAVDVVKRQLGDDNDANNRAQKAEATIAEMIKALSDHGAPRRYEVYGAPDKLGPLLSPVERLRVTLSIHHWKADAAERRAHEAEEAREALLQERRFARDALLDAGAPCRADGFDLDLAARIRSLSR